MANRDVALGIAGVVLGVILGAGSVLYTQEASLSASSTEVASSYFAAPDENPPRARGVKEQAVDDTTADSHRAIRDSVREHNAAPSETDASSPVVPADACDVARNITARVKAAVKTTIPNQVPQNRYSDQLLKVLDGIENDFCGQ